MKRLLFFLLFFPSISQGHILEILTSDIKTVCPIDGVSMSNNDPTTVQIHFKQEATDQEKQRALNILKSFDWAQPVPAVISEIEVLREKVLTLERDMTDLKSRTR